MLDHIPALEPSCRQTHPCHQHWHAHAEDGRGPCRAQQYQKDLQDLTQRSNIFPTLSLLQLGQAQLQLHFGPPWEPSLHDFCWCSRLWPSCLPFAKGRVAQSLLFRSENIPQGDCSKENVTVWSCQSVSILYATLSNCQSFLVTVVTVTFLESNCCNCQNWLVFRKFIGQRGKGCLLLVLSSWLVAHFFGNCKHNLARTVLYFEVWTLSIGKQLHGCNMFLFCLEICVKTRVNAFLTTKLWL